MALDEPCWLALRLAVAETGEFVVSWTSAAQDGNGDGVYARRYDAAGRSLGQEFRVSQHMLDNQGVSRVAMDADGDFVVVWTSRLQDGSGDGVYGRRYAVPLPPQPGDTDGDVDVDVHDLNNVRNHFGESGPGVIGDTDGDGAVGVADLNAVRNHFGEAAGSAATARLARNAIIDSDGLLDARSQRSTARLPGALTASSADVLFTAIGAEASPAGAKPRRSPWGAR